MSRALWKSTAFVSRALNFIAFSCSMGSLSAMTPRLPKADPLGEPVERLHLVGCRRHPPAQWRIREVVQQLHRTDHPADLPEGRVGGILPRTGAQPLEQRGGGDGAFAYGDGHAHQVAELGLDTAEAIAPADFGKEASESLQVDRRRLHGNGNGSRGGRRRRPARRPGHISTPSKTNVPAMCPGRLTAPPGTKKGEARRPRPIRKKPQLRADQGQTRQYG